MSDAAKTGAVLVVGGGISGLTAALEAAEVGNDVYIIEKNPYFGGRVAQLNQYFPKLCPPTCGLEINFKRVKNNRRIRPYTMTTVKSVSGGPGNYEVTLETAPRYVNSNCTACGDCAAVCPVVRPDEFNQGLSSRRAIYSPFPQAVPSAYVINVNECLGHNPSVCAKCIDACDKKCINFHMSDEEIVEKVGSIVVATGLKPYDPATKPSYYLKTIPVN